jgi:hypothetical protein
MSRRARFARAVRHAGDLPPTTVDKPVDQSDQPAPMLGARCGARFRSKPRTVQWSLDQIHCLPIDTGTPARKPGPQSFRSTAHGVTTAGLPSK